MKRYWADIVSSVLAIVGGVVMFAKLESYSWWLLGTWKGALGVLAVLGLGIVAVNIGELVRLPDLVSMFAATVWVVAAATAITSLFATTTKAEFIWTGALIGFGWLTLLTEHVWRGSHRHTPHLAATH